LRVEAAASLTQRLESASGLARRLEPTASLAKSLHDVYGVMNQAVIRVQFIIFSKPQAAK
jgi:hypothetical protein